MLGEATYAGSLPYASATLRCMRQRGRENSLNARVPISPPGGPQSGRIPHVVYDVVFTALSQREESKTTKANACCFTIVSAIAEYWHTKFQHVRYVLFGESLQKHSKCIAKSPSRGLKSQQKSHKIYKSTVSRSMTWRHWANTYVRSHLGCGTDPFSSDFAGLTNISKTQKRCR